MDAAAQAIMDQGTKVGEVAQKLFPGGIKLERVYEPEKQAEQSLKALKLRKPLFEAGFIYNRAYALADILAPAGNNTWDLIEVKSSTGMKDEYYYDVAFQKHTYEGAGIKIRKCYLMYINNQYIRKGRLEPEKMFLKEDITEESERLKSKIRKEIDAMLKIISRENVPNVKVGPHCDKPHTCPLEDTCWKFLPDKDHIFVLYSGGRRAFELMDRGILKVVDISTDISLSYKQGIQVSSHKNGTPHIDKGAIKVFLTRLGYPIYFLDFETINSAIPPYDLSKPYENIPFQYSLYIMKEKCGKSIHHSYLAPGDKDPRPEILKQLKNLLGNSGSIVAYSASFEKRAFKNAVEAYPQFGNWFSKTEERFVDLLEPFRSFSYYHPRQAGSTSLKDVLPTITGATYEGIEITDGSMASREYYRVTFGENIDQKERQRVHAALEKYCDLDTRGMIEILQELDKKCS